MVKNKEPRGVKKMHLELRKVQIQNIAFGEENAIRDHVLYLNKDSLTEEVMKDKRIKKVDFDIARPGESVRIIPVKDVIEPRAKLEGDIFPGIFKETMEEGGYGVTYALKGCAVTTTGPIVGFQEGLIDMSGPAAEYTPFSKLNHLVMVIEKQPEFDAHEHEQMVRMAGIRLAAFVGQLAVEQEEYESEEYTWDSIGEKYAQYPDLPKVVYVYNCMSQGLLHDTYFYGRDSKQMVPTMITPLEVMDGALVSGNCVSPGSKTTTWHHLNNAVIEECMKKHGKEINFMGIVLNPLMVSLKEKYRDCMLTIRMVEMLGADGVIISQEGFGNPTTDLMLVCQGLEKRGIKTVIITNEDAGVDGMSESLPDSVTEADAIVSTGNSNATIMLPKMDKTIGVLSDVAKTTGGNVDSIQDDGRLLIEIHGIMGGHNLQGNTYLGAITI